MASETSGGFGPVLSNRDFRALWMAQLLTQVAQNAVNFIQMALINDLTHSALLQGVMILAFTVPGVLFSPIAGVVVDRFPKKWILVASNVIRVLLSVAYLPFLASGKGTTFELLAIYIISFIAASVAQFFAPAEASTIPLLVGNDRLLAANSLFNLTMALSQVVGLLVLGPIIFSVVHVQGGFLMIAVMYLAAAVLSNRIPRDHPSALLHAGDGVSRWIQVWEEAREGWQFVSKHGKLAEATSHMVTINTLVMVLAMIAPGYATRVLGLPSQSAVLVFAPAGAGMLLATGLAGRWGHWLRRIGAVYIGLVLVGLAFGTLGLLNLDYQRILERYPGMTFSMSSATMVLAFILGLALSGVNILAQTTVQEESPSQLRGRVFSILYMLNALVGIPPMLAMGAIADLIGIPRVMVIAGVIAFLVAGGSLVIRRYGSLGAAGRAAWGGVQTLLPASPAESERRLPAMPEPEEQRQEVEEVRQ